ncbi:paired small multidrug resistance pump [Elusimicrobium posterum]|uniref:DMT family transporter n=1 Tax=Elusimicrobium posterum TaxID=3116653 RepID=UPI003C756DC7
MAKSWIYVFLTCLFELMWVYGFNVASAPWHWAVIVLIIISDFYFLAKACEYLPTGTVYAMFSAIGTMGIALMDIFLFEAPVSYLKLIFVGVIIVGVVSLKLADNKTAKGGAL